MAEEQAVSVTAHEHIEPNLINIILIIVISLLIGLPVLKWLGHKFPGTGLPGIVG